MYKSEINFEQVFIRNGKILDKKNLVTTYSPVPLIGTVPSAQVGLTSLFGMGRGVAPPQ